MTTISQPKRHTSELFHRHHSQRSVSSQSLPQGQDMPVKFQGTDAVEQNRRVAVQRIVEVHDALELSRQTSSAASDRSASPSAISTDSFTVDFNTIPFPDAELRTFRYFLRIWDPSSSSDPEFDEAIRPSKRHFEETALKHFFRRIRFWHESEEMAKAAREKIGKEPKRRDKDRESALGRLWNAEKGRQEHALPDDLKEATTREGLAQLLWTLLHDHNAPLAPELLEECTEAVKKSYGIKC
ncbi:hypothetical protein IQ07DRAFT_598753 [Pyrenochaeta sp. DS3sAY3a]|nr:hypothetical protein IQ07DRAFT_598753 [Pyrenochaeta sp. DS3sAY3a]